MKVLFTNEMVTKAVVHCYRVVGHCKGKVNHYHVTLDHCHGKIDHYRLNGVINLMRQGIIMIEL